MPTIFLRAQYRLLPFNISVCVNIWVKQFLLFMYIMYTELLFYRNGNNIRNANSSMATAHLQKYVAVITNTTPV